MLVGLCSFKVKNLRQNKKTANLMPAKMTQLNFLSLIQFHYLMNVGNFVKKLVSFCLQSTVHLWVLVCLPSFVFRFGSYDLARGKVGPFSVLNICKE